MRRLIAGAKTLYHRTMLMTLYGTGLRRSELLQLKVCDIDSQRTVLRVVVIYTLTTDPLMCGAGAPEPKGSAE